MEQILITREQYQADMKAAALMAIEEFDKRKEPDNGEEFITAKEVAEQNKLKGHVHLLRKIKASGVETRQLGKFIGIKRKDVKKVLQSVA